MQRKNVVIVVSLLLVSTLIIGCIKTKEQETKEQETMIVKPTTMIEEATMSNTTIGEEAMMSNTTIGEETMMTNATAAEEAMMSNITIEEETMMPNATMTEDTVVEEEVMSDAPMVEGQNMEDEYDSSYIFKVDDENVMLDRNVRLIELATEEGMAIINVDGDRYRLIYNTEQEIKGRIIKITDLDGNNQTVKIMAKYG